MPHFLVIPHQALGHVNPLMQLSQVLANQGCKVTFITTESNHSLAKAASSGQDSLKGSKITLVSLPDGLGPEDDRSDQVRIILSIKRTMPEKLPKLIEEINALESENKISCLVVGMYMGWALVVGQKLGIKGAVFFPASATRMASCDCIQRLIDEGIINSYNGLPFKNEKIQLSPNMHLMDPANLPWCSMGKLFFDNLLEEMQILKLGEWWLCNTTYELEPAAFSILPKLLPIGPLMASEQHSISFWQEDKTCLEWLDQQPPQSVIYVSFGSLSVFKSNQFKELALGLDLLNKPFLWVVRPGNDNKAKYEYPEEFKGTKGKIVGWAPQKKILNHPTIACFISHCGWNSTMEGIYSGVPFLCLPYFSDQFLNESYICYVWKIGLGFGKDENGVISRGEIKKKVEKLLGDKEIKARSLN